MKKNLPERLRSAFAGTSRLVRLPESATELGLRAVYLARMARFIDANRGLDLDVGYDRFQLFDRVFESERLDGPIDYLEFGTAAGHALRHWLARNRHASSRFDSFDTFTGLPEAWDGVPTGTFSQGGRPPEVEDPRCHFHVGLFSTTLPDFLRARTRDQRLVVHLDADLYSSTLYVLTMLAPRLVAGDILILADFCSLRHPTHVFRAFEDFVSAYALDYTLLSTSNHAHQGVVRVERAMMPVSTR